MSVKHTQSIIYITQYTSRYQCMLFIYQKFNLDQESRLDCCQPIKFQKWQNLFAVDGIQDLGRDVLHYFRCYQLTVLLELTSNNCSKVEKRCAILSLKLESNISKAFSASHCHKVPILQYSMRHLTRLQDNLVALRAKNETELNDDS